MYLINRTPPNYMIEVGKNAHRYFDRDLSRGEKRYELKPIEKYSREQGKSEQPSKRYFSAKQLPDLINSYPIMRKAQMSTKEIDKGKVISVIILTTRTTNMADILFVCVEKQSRLAFIDFLQGILNLNPIERWSPQQAKQHPFVTGEKYTGPFQPPFIPRKQHHVIPPSPKNNIQSNDQKQQVNDSLLIHHQSSPPMNNNGYRNIPPQQSYSDTFLTPAYSSLPNHYDNSNLLGNTNNKRSSYVPPLPSVLEPPHDTIYNHSHQQHHQQQVDGHHHLMQQQQIQQQQQQQLHHLHQQQTLNIPQTMSSNGSNGNRPRANTLGTMQVPPQIQWATVDHSDGTVATEGSLFSPYYPYGHQHQHHQPSSQFLGDQNQSNEALDQHEIGILPRWSNNNRQTIDLERDGDWQEDSTTSIPTSSPMMSMAVPPPRSSSHRRSSSSVRFSDIPTTLSSSVSSSMINGNSSSSASRSSVASLHRLMRGHAVPYSRQDIEWDGVIHQPPHQQLQHNSNSGEFNENDSKWKNDKPGWMIA